MTRYEEQFYREFSQLVNTMKEIAKDIKEIKNQLVPQSTDLPMSKEETKPHCFTYGEICMMKEEYEKARDMLSTQRMGEERNDK